MIKGGKRFVKLIVHFNYQGKLRGTEIMAADGPPNTAHILITADGSVLGRLPRQVSERNMMINLC